MSKQKKLVTSGVTLALVALGVVALQRASRGEAPPATSSAVASAERRTIELVAEASGLVEPVRVVEVKSNASGEVKEVFVDTGDLVPRGTLLVEIDPRDVQSAVDQAAADLESARVRSATAEAEQGRARRLMETGLIPAQDYERTVEATAAAQASLVRARTSLRLAQEKRQDVTIRAPIEGTVIERAVEPGQIIASATSNVSGGTTLFRMADLSAMQVRAKVDEVDIGQIHAGQVARVTAEAYPGRTFAGTVTKVEPQAVVEQNVTMFPVLVRLENPDGLLRPGMNAEVQVDVARRRDVVAIPNAAVVSLREARAAANVLGVELPAMRPGGPAGGAAGRERSVGGHGQTAPSPGRAEGATRGSGSGRPEGARGSGAGPGPSRGDPADRGGRGEWGGGAVAGEASAAVAGGGESRPALVFVPGPAAPEARRVLLGLSDWEHTEVLQGLEAGEQVILVSVAQLQRQQQQLSDRLRQRFGGPLGGSGGGAGAGRGGAPGAGGRGR
jgi:HlyD family secretion protein